MNKRYMDFYAPVFARQNPLNAFLYTPLYIAAYAMIVFFCWYFKLEALGIFLTILIACYILCTQEDTLPLLPILFMVAYTFPTDIDPLTYAPLMPYLALVAVAIALHFVRFKPKFRFTKMLWPMIAISCALLLGGAGSISAKDYAGGVAFALLLGFALVALYLAIGLFYAPPRDVDAKGYVMTLLVVMGVLLSFETFAFFFRTDIPIAYWTKGNLDLGWGISNNVSTLLLISTPASIYMAAKSKKSTPVFILLAAVMFLANVMTFSRGGIISACIVAVPTAIAGGIYAQNRKMYWVSLASALVVTAAALAGTGKLWAPLIKSAFEMGMDSSGRDLLYKEAWQGFMDHPIFGLGLGFKGDHFTIPNMPMYWFHSTFFQIIGSLGLVGLIAYAYFYASRYFLILRRDMFNVFIFLCLLGFEGYSMIDTGTFVPIPTMMIAMLITLAVERENAVADAKRAEHLAKQVF